MIGSTTGEFLVTDGGGKYWFEDMQAGWTTHIGSAFRFITRKDAEQAASDCGGYVISFAEATGNSGTPEQPPTEPKKTHVPAAELGLPPWRYACVGDSDGERVGYDHFVYDATGEEMMTAPNERVGAMAGAAPQLLEALVWLMDATTPAEGVEQTAELKKARQRAMEAIRAATAMPKLTPPTPPTDAASVAEVFAVWEQSKTEEEDARKMRDFFQWVYAQRNEKARRVGELIAGKILAEHPKHTEQRRAVWATIGGRLFLVRREGNDRDGFRSIIEEQETPAAY